MKTKGKIKNNGDIVLKEKKNILDLMDEAGDLTLKNNILKKQNEEIIRRNNAQYAKLITCPVCKNQISNMASECQYCGQPVDFKQTLADIKKAKKEEKIRKKLERKTRK